jgi:hypothetical protein
VTTIQDHLPYGFDLFVLLLETLLSLVAELSELGGQALRAEFFGFATLKPNGQLPSTQLPPTYSFGFPVGGGELIALVLQSAEFQLQLVHASGQLRDGVLRVAQVVSQLLVLSGELVLGLAGLVQLVHGPLQLLLLVAEVPLGLLVQVDGLLQSGLQVDVDPLQLLDALLQLPGGGVGLLQVDDEDLHLGLETHLLLLQVVDLDEEGLDVLLLFGDPGGVLAAELLHLFGASDALGFILGFVHLDLALGLDELAFEVEASLALFFELDADGFEFNFDLVELGFEEGAAALVVFGAAPGVLELAGELALQVVSVLEGDLQEIKHPK